MKRMWDIEAFRKELEEIVNVDSGSKDTGGVGSVGSILKEKFAAAGLRVESFDENTRIQANSHEADDFDVLLVGHMDTVFPKGTASLRPYTEKDGLAHGPGVADMKGGLILILHLVRRLRQEYPMLRLCAALNGDEEVGSGRSKEWLQQLARHTKYAFVFEPGRDGNAFVRSRKGCIDLRVVFHGKASHAGAAPEKGASAVVELARWITALTSLQDLSIGTSVNAGLVEGGTAANVVPDYAEAKFDIRVKQPEEIDRIRNAVEQLADSISVKGVTVETEFSGMYLPMNPSEVTAELMRRLEAVAAESSIEIGWADTGGVSDANHIAGLGVPTICGCGPCGGNLHSEDEYMELASIERRLDLMYGLLSAAQNCKNKQ